MARLGLPRQVRRAPLPETTGGDRPPALENRSPEAYPPETYVQGIIEFLDKRWTRAEGDAAIARRSALLLSAVVVCFSVAAAGLAVAVAALVVLTTVAHDLLLDPSPRPLVSGLLLAAGAGGLIMVVRRRSDRRRGGTGRGTPERAGPATARR